MSFSAPRHRPKVRASAIRLPRVRIATSQIVSSGQNNPHAAHSGPRAPKPQPRQNDFLLALSRARRRTHFWPHSSRARILLQRLGLQKLTEVTIGRSPGDRLGDLLRVNLSRTQKKSHYLRNPLPNMLLGPIPRVCQHRPKRTLCRFRTAVRNKVRSTQKRSSAFRCRAATMPRASSGKWLFSLSI